ncbi:Pyrroline-5-carboxylate reductase [Paenibacillus solanacearum]|uniref:Pyrroline-5-carboxylate reductase n=1 Tax=Paenibacillus solanacearum TaxID=2048548 RepID=A0A916JV58_9BACL|nr:pyrroline-5-carboxylate reductase [Paenibacillus solanacearum]CAG7605251.1 Pyrroline-5-carboxylate reductase [Paenibacillus solanacearum]
MTSSISQASMAFIGAGSMAEAIIRGLTAKGEGPASRLFVINRSDTAKLESLHARYGVSYAASQGQKDEAISHADIIVLAFKPKDAVDGLIGIRSLVRPEQLIVSVIAGMSIDTIKGLLGSDSQPVVRTMPNTSSTIGLGATGISFSSTVSTDQRELALAMFGATGIVSVVDEPLLNAVNGVSGSGPAYIYYMMEAMIAGGVELGLDPEEARRLTVQTVLGAAHMVQTTGEDPAELRRKVTSPGGTTQAAIETLDSHGFAEGVAKAMVRCAERAGEMGAAISASVTSQTK